MFIKKGATNIKEKKELLACLLQYITENKKRKIEQKIVHRTRHLTVVLEEVYQSHNASAILRSAECFGLQDVYVVQNRNRFNAKGAISMGASKWLSVKSYNRIADCCKDLKKRGYKIVATTPHKHSYTLDQLPIDTKCALLFGTEETGLTQEAMNLADEFVTIPMYGFTESFNVSVSVAICVHYLIEKIKNSKIKWELSEKELLDLRLEWARAIIPCAKSLSELFHQLR